MSVRDVLKKSRSKVVPVEISTGTVYVKALSGEGRAAYTDLSKKVDGVLPLHTIAAIALCEEDGSMCFDTSSEKAIALANLELKDVDGADLQSICLKLFEVSGLATGSASEAEKKSEASQKP